MGSQHTNSGTIRVFISYSRRDMEIADRLVEALDGEGFEVIIDRRDLPYGEEWLKELTDFIAGADTVVALVSPAFIASKACNWELGQVKATNKRLVPVVIEPVAIADLPETIGKIHLLPATGAFDLVLHLKALVNALNTDRQWIKEHTRLASHARQWIARGRARSLLLRGSALADAESWQDRQPRAAPAPSDEILELMLASRRATTERQRSIAAGSLLAAFFAFALAGFAAFQWQRAETSYAAARTNLDSLIKDLAGEMQNAEGMPVTTVQRILKNGEALAANLKEASGGDMRLEASRAAMFYEFGKTYQKINRRGEAIKASDESLAIRRRLAAAYPQDREFAAGLAESLDLAGDLEREQKRHAEARALYSESVGIGVTLNGKYPANADYAVSVSKTLVRLGDLDRLASNFFEAKGRYRDAFGKIQSVLRAGAGEPPPELQRELTWDYNKMGDAHTGLKEYPEAEAAYSNGLCIREYLFSKDPDQHPAAARHFLEPRQDRGRQDANARLSGRARRGIRLTFDPPQAFGERHQEPDLAPRHRRGPTPNRGDQGQGGRFLRGQDVLSRGGGSAPRLEEGGAGRCRFRGGPCGQHVRREGSAGETP